MNAILAILLGVLVGAVAAGLFWSGYHLGASRAWREAARLLEEHRRERLRQ